MCQDKDLFSIIWSDEVLQALIFLIREKIFDWAIEEFISLISEEAGTSGVDINDVSKGVLFRAD